MLGAISLRLRDDFLAITTIGLNFVVVAMFQYVPFFGGAMGIYAIPLPTIGSHTFGNLDFLAVGLVMVAVVTALSLYLQRTWFGAALIAIRDDELAAAATGIPVAPYKVGAFALSAALAGLAGSLYAPFISAVTPTSFGFSESVVILAMLMLGGVGSVLGALVGAVILGALPEVFRVVSDYRLLMFGLVLVLVLRFAPFGLTGIPRALRGRATYEPVNRARRSGRSHAGQWGRGPDNTTRGMSGADGPMALLEVSDLVVRFGGLTAVDHVTMAVEPRDFVAIIGPNGAGKTTLFNVIAGAQRPTAGEVRFRGRSTRRLGATRMSHLGVARTFQVARPFGSLTVRENVRLGAAGERVLATPRTLGRRRGVDDARVDAALELVGLESLADAPASTLTVGALRRLELGRALVGRPEPAAPRRACGRDRHGRIPAARDGDQASAGLGRDRPARRAPRRLRAIALREGHRARCRSCHRRRHAGGDTCGPRRHRRLPRSGSEPAGTRGGEPVIDASPLLEVSGLNAGYGRIEVLHDVSLEVGRGEFVAIVGANGAGKTTLLRSIMGLVAGRGRISFSGEDLSVAVGECAGSAPNRVRA